MRSPDSRRPLLTLYTRPGCGLCRRVERVLAQLEAEGLAEWQLVNIESDPELLADLKERIPVLDVEGGPRFEGRISEYRLRRVLATWREEPI